MQLKMYSIRDSKAKAYNQPWFAKSDEEAERNFAFLAKKPDSMISQFPEDYDLFYVGTYDDQTCKIDALETPQHMIKAVNLVKN